MRLAREVKKTIRKVNALEKIAIPDLEESLKSISDRLEEQERENMMLLKSVKARLEARLEAKSR
jgi:V/A-type H+-transporting ATPase subunit D